MGVHGKRKLALIVGLILFLSYIYTQVRLNDQHRGHHRLKSRPTEMDTWPTCSKVPCVHGVYVGCNVSGGIDRCVCYADREGNGFWQGRTCDVCAMFYYGKGCDVFCHPQVTCHGHGVCVKHHGSCSCEANYVGVNCEKRIYTADHTRREAVRKEMAHSWKGYRLYAFGHDELMPVTKESRDWAVDGIGLTLIDSLDTLYLMGLMAEFNEARDWLVNKFRIKRDGLISVFETTIRVVGGLLGVYTLSKDRVFLIKAMDVVEELKPAFSQYTHGIPASMIDPVTGELLQKNDWASGMNVLSEFGSLQLEFNYVANSSGHVAYRELTDKIMELLKAIEPTEATMGLFPVYFDGAHGHFSTSMQTMGGMSDSYYEYLLKQWIQSGHKHPFALGMYQRAMDGMRQLLVQRNAKYVFLVQRIGNDTRQRMDHLSCFVPGMLVLGLMHGAGGETENAKTETLDLAKELMATCVHMYEFTPTGLSPEDVVFDENDEMVSGSNEYMLRPEVIESLFYLWRFTHDELYRDKAWQIFQSIVTHCRVPTGGYSGLRNVLTLKGEDALQYDKMSQVSGDAKYTNNMESFWIAETLKYLYLLYSEDELMDLQKVVFNTEAHPFPIWWS